MSPHPVFPPGFQHDWFVLLCVFVGMSLAEITNPTRIWLARLAWGANVALGLGLMVQLIVAANAP